MSVLPIRSISVAACVAVALLATAPAQATRSRHTSAGGACQAANGAAAAKFTFANNSLVNTGTVDQYVICHFQMDDDTSALDPPIPSTLAVSLTAGTTPGTAVCVAQFGYYANGTNHLRSSITRNVALAAGADGWAMWDPSTPWSREFYYETLTLNCRLPGGFRMGLIEWLE